MATPKQTTTNHSSQKGAGSSTPEAQAASRFNPEKHGILAAHQIMFDETAGDLADLAAEYHDQYRAANSAQRFLVDSLIANEWRIRRSRRVEAELWEHATNDYLAQNIEAAACSSGDAFASAAPTFERLQRVANSCERAYHRALKELQHQQVARGHALGSPQPDAGPTAAPAPAPAPAAPQAPQPQQSTSTSANLGSFRQNPKSPGRGAPKSPDIPLPTPAFSSPAGPGQPRGNRTQTFR
jgi:hypothetical protein